MMESAAIHDRSTAPEPERMNERMDDRHCRVAMATSRVRTWRALIASLSELAFRDLDRPANLNDEQ
ncbi:MAG: hypothetical protein U1E46_07655 [Hyphomicrobiales bacterium]